MEMETAAERHGLCMTGKYMAAARAMESKRPDPLFDDPFAERFAGDDGVEFLRGVAEACGLPESALASAVALRTRFFDDALTRACSGEGKCDQVVLLGVGGDARSTRLLPSIEGARKVFEVDLPNVMALRREVIYCTGTTATAANAVPIECDVRDLGVLRDCLGKSGHDSRLRTAWLAEGLTMYLTESELDALLGFIQSLSAPGSRFIGDFVNRRMFRSDDVAVMQKAWAKAGAAPRSGCDAPEWLLARFGFVNCHVTQLGEEGCNFGRLPQGSPAAGVPRVLEDDPIPRNLFVVAST